MTAFLFITHYINNGVYQRYLKIKNDLNKLNYDVFFVCPNTLITLYYDIDKIYTYQNEIVTTMIRDDAPYYVNPSKVLEQFYKDNNTQYDVYYVCEYDVEFSGDWSYLCTKCDNENTDLMGTYVDEINTLEKQNLFFHYFYWYFDNIEPRENKPYYRGCFSFYRISNRALKFLCSSTDKLLDYIYEIYMPTLLLRNGYTYCDFWIDHDNIHGLDMLGKYGYGVYIKSASELDKPNKLYTCYKL